MGQNKRMELHIRLTERDKKLFSDMAEKEGISLSEFARKALYEAAFTVMRKSNTSNDE